MRQQQGTDKGFSESVVETPVIASQFDDTPNVSSKSFLVPGNEMWKINFAHLAFDPTGSAEAGARRIDLDITDAAGNTINIQAGATQTNSAANHYLYLQGIYRETSFTLNEIQVPMPTDFYLNPGWVMKFHDVNEVDPTVDDLTVFFQYKKFIV